MSAECREQKTYRRQSFWRSCFCWNIRYAFPPPLFLFSFLFSSCLFSSFLISLLLFSYLLSSSILDLILQYFDRLLFISLRCIFTFSFYSSFLFTYRYAWLPIHPFLHPLPSYHPRLVNLALHWHFLLHFSCLKIQKDWSFILQEYFIFIIFAPCSSS